MVVMSELRKDELIGGIEVSADDTGWRSVNTELPVAVAAGGGWMKPGAETGRGGGPRGWKG